jgi:hypothetical protein
MKCLLEYVSQFLIGLSATTLGVFLGLFLQKRYERSKKNKEAEEIKGKIKVELDDAIHTIKTTRERKDELFLSPIKTPVFKAYVDSTKITLLDKYPWYDDLLNLYKYIDDFNAWHNLKTDKSFNDNISNLEKIDDGLKAVEKLIQESVVIQEFKNTNKRY